MLSQILNSYGLPESEIAIFNFLSLMGDQPAGTIAKKANLARSSCYSGLSHLIELGLISQIRKNGLAFYSTGDLSVLLDNLKRQKTQEIQQINWLKRDLHQRNSKASSFDAPKSLAHYYSGHAGITALLQQIVALRPAILKIYLSRPDFVQTKLAEMLSENPLSAQCITTDSTVTFLPSPLRLLPAVFNFGVDVILTQNQLALISTREDFGILVESSQIASSSGKLFDFLWRIGKSRSN